MTPRSETVTVLFTDLVGSTALATRLGDDAAQALRRVHDGMLTRQFQRFDGEVVKSLGDGFMVAFTSARRALTCSVAVQRALEEHNRRQPTEQQLSVRIGLHTGDVIGEEADLFGSAVNAAARIAAKAQGSQILVSPLVKDLVGRDPEIPLADRGRFLLKGFPQRWRLFEAVWRAETDAPPAFAERTPFVGREEERAELRRLLDEAAGGRGALVLIGGEPGVGKTRLAQELMAEARQRSMTALIGRCYEMEGAPPYIPFVEMVEAAARAFTPEALRSALGENAPEVAQLMPELRRMFPDVSETPQLPPEQERRYLFNGMREFIARSGRTQPLLLVLDDLHWADDSTMLLVQHIAQQLHEMPVLIVGTYRDVELDVARPLARALEELVRQRLARRHSLKRFSEDGVRAMLQALTGQEPPASLVQAIYAETEGNAFFVEEVFKHLAEEGRLFDTKGRWNADLRIDEVDVPQGVRLVIGRRLERLSEQTRQVLTSAAVIGRGFSFQLLQALGEVEPDALLDAVDEAERAHLISSSEDGPEARLAFAHELIRQTLLSGLSLPRRQRLHLRVAEAIEQTHAADPEAHAADLAHHLFQAGSAADPRKTVRFLALAGDRAQAAGAFEEALRYYENAIPLQPAGGLRGLADLLVKRGRAKRALGHWDDAVADWRAALSAYEELADGQAVGALAADITMQALWGSGGTEAVDIWRRGLVALGKAANPDRCRLLAYGAVALSMSGDYAMGERMHNRARLMAEELGDRRLLGEALAFEALHRLNYWQFKEALDVGLKAADLLREAGAPWQLADALWVVQVCARNAGDFDLAQEIRDELEPLAVRIGHLAAAHIARWNGMMQELTLVADIDQLHSYLQDAIEQLRSIGWSLYSQLISQVALINLWKGRLAEALNAGQEAVRLEPSPAHVYAGFESGALFLLRAYVGDRDLARAMFEEKRSELPRPGQANSVGKWTTLLFVVEGLAVIGHRDEAADLLPLVSEAIDTGAVLRVFDVRLLQTVAGIAAAAGSQWEKAEEHYQTALRQAHELPVVIEQPEVRRWYARMLIDRDARGDRDKAFRLLTEAVAMYKKIGMPKHVEMAEDLLRETAS